MTPTLIRPVRYIHARYKLRRGEYDEGRNVPDSYVRDKTRSSGALPTYPTCCQWPRPTATI